jgi:hypothetical protein
LSHANAWGKGNNSKGWAFRMLLFSKREEEVRHLEEISKNLLGNLKTINSLQDDK